MSFTCIQVYQYQCSIFVIMYSDIMQDCACLSFAAPRGELQPYGKVSVTVECKPEEIGRLRSQLEILVGQKAVRYGYSVSHNDE